MQPARHGPGPAAGVLSGQGSEKRLTCIQAAITDGNGAVHDRKTPQGIVGPVAGEETPPSAFPRRSPSGRDTGHRESEGCVRLSGQRYRRRQRQRKIDRAVRGRLRLSGSGGRRERFRAVHAVSRLPPQGGGARGPQRRSGHRFRLCNSGGAALHALAALQRLEPEFPRPKERQPAKAPRLSQDPQQPQQPVRSARRPEHVAFESRTAGDGSARLPGGVRASYAPVSVFGSREPVQREQDTAFRCPGRRSRLFGTAHVRRRAGHSPPFPGKLPNSRAQWS